jgi:NAD(P)-dependent dehydrogenase (short-subunit alcohol dehydrogenase family)
MVARAAEALGGIDILVNAAAQPCGQRPAPRWDEVSEEALFAEIRVKVLGYLRVSCATWRSRRWRRTWPTGSRRTGSP